MPFLSVEGVLILCLHKPWHGQAVVRLASEALSIFVLLLRPGGGGVQMTGGTRFNGAQVASRTRMLQIGIECAGRGRGKILNAVTSVYRYAWKIVIEK